MVLTPQTVFDRIRTSVRETPGARQRKVGFAAMGTWCQLIFSAPSQAAGDYFLQEALRWLAEFEARYSRFIPDSLIGRINRAAGREWVEIDPETERLFALCHELNFFTRGAFDPTALPLIQLWNWKAKPSRVPGPEEIQAALNLTGWRKLQRRPGAVHLPEKGMSLDLGGIGKEYAVDRVTQLAQEHGLGSVLVDFGQDIRVVGVPADKPRWHIGLEDARMPGHCWIGLGLIDQAVASSGDYLRHFTVDGRRYGHILDPRTGYPVDNGCLAVSVVASTCTIAGILSTTAFILGSREGLQLIESYYGAAGCVTTFNARHHTKRFYENVAT